MSHRSRLIRIVVLTAAALLVPLGPAVAAAPTPTAPAATAIPTNLAPPNITGSGKVTFAAAPGNATDLDQRTSFTYNRMLAGTVIHDFIGVSNFSDQPENFTLGATDAFTNTAGALTLNTDDHHPTDIGTWVHFDRTQVTIPAHARLNEPFVVTVPANAKPGDHTGGVFAEYRVGAGSSGPGTFTQDHRVGVVMYVSVPGRVTASFDIKSLSTGYDGTLNPVGGGSAHVSYTITNTGNVNLAGTQNIAVKGLYGITLASIKGPVVPELLPGQSFKVNVKLSGVFPLGWMSTKVSITPKQTHPNSAGPSPTSISKVNKSAGFWGTPVLVLILIVLIVAGVWGGRRWLRYRDNARADALYDAVERARRETADQLTSTTAGAGDERGTEQPTTGA